MAFPACLPPRSSPVAAACLPLCPACPPTCPPTPAEVYGFSSERKMASVLVRRNGKLRLYNKGAAEMVLTCCTAMVNSAGQSVPMTEVGGWEREGGSGWVGGWVGSQGLLGAETCRPAALAMPWAVSGCFFRKVGSGQGHWQACRLYFTMCSCLSTCSRCVRS